jgi:hypothetical protein
MRIPIASKSMDAVISIFDCGRVVIRLPRDATSWCPDHHMPRFVKSIGGNEFIFEPPDKIEWTPQRYLQPQEPRQVLLQ